MDFDSIHISKATEQNWKRLGSDAKTKLTRRANKTMSPKRIIATNYLNNDDVISLLDHVLSIDASAGDIMYTLSISYLKWAKIIEMEHVQNVLRQYTHYRLLNIQVPDHVWSYHEDVLGFIYQSIITEGERISTGQYYTSKDVVKYILNGKTLANGETFLDPCCGSGAFLLEVETNTPTCLYGFDINPIAVLIASTNLLVKYADHEFTPNIYCLDYLSRDLSSCLKSSSEALFHFNNVYTNPPWGADKANQYSQHCPEIKSNERACMVIVQSLRRLKANGVLCLLLPSSILKTKTHKDIRKHILSNTSIQRIDLFSNNFNGVFTDYFCIKLRNTKTDRQSYYVSNGEYTKHIELTDDERSTGCIRTTVISCIDKTIIDKIKSLRHDDLSHSKWALGIVTGDNKNKVKKNQIDGLEPIYTGKEIRPFNLSKTNSYINFAPKTFQQCAREELYRAPEKLIYKFIAKYPIVAYDDKQRLCLNSANVLIPDLDGISIRSAAALLNSSLFRYYYALKFTDIKVLKGNLQKLPFPKISQEQDKVLGEFVSTIQSLEFTDENQQELDALVYQIFGINRSEQEHIKNKLN